MHNTPADGLQITPADGLQPPLSSNVIPKFRMEFNMAEKQITSEWTGIKGKIMAWGLSNPLMRRFEFLLIGDYMSTFLREVFHIIKDNQVILDVGAGSGYFSLAVAKKLSTGKVICLDLSEIMLQHLEHNAEKKSLRDRIQILRAEASSSGLEDESVDLVFSNFVFHELSNPETVLSEIFRVLKPRGWVIITDFKRDTLIGNLIGAFHREAHGPFRVNELDTLLAKVGLSSVKIRQGRQYIIGLGRK